MTGELVSHLSRQVRSAQRLLEIVLAQGAAIRARDVEGVLARLADLQGEMAQRLLLEQERERLMSRAASTLGLRPDDVDVESMLQLEPTADCDQARRSRPERHPDPSGAVLPRPPDATDVRVLAGGLQPDRPHLGSAGRERDQRTRVGRLPTPMKSVFPITSLPDLPVTIEGAH
jgi:hypothetical protein